MVEKTLIVCGLLTLLGAQTPGHVRADAAERAPEAPRGSTATPSAEERSVPRRFTLGLDVVLGRGETLTLNQAEGETHASQARADLQTASLVTAAEYAIDESFSVGLQLPLTWIRIMPTDSDSRVTFAPGNLQLEGEVETELLPGLEFRLAIVVALPTATGSELPSNEVLATRSQADAARQLDEYDAFSAQRAGTAVRGHEEDPLFEPDHLGLVPTVSVDYRAGVLALHGYIEFENLIRTNATAAYPFIGEIDVGIHVRYLPTKLVELAAKAWTNAGLIGESDFIAALEPQLRLHLEDCDLAAGLIVPFAGESLDTSFIGLRLVASARL